MTMMFVGFAGCIQSDDEAKAPAAKEGRDYDSKTCAIPGWVVNEKDEPYTGEVHFGKIRQGTRSTEMQGTNDDGTFLLRFLEPATRHVGLSDYKQSYQDVVCVGGHATDPVKIVVDCTLPHTVCR